MTRRWVGLALVLALGLAAAACGAGPNAGPAPAGDISGELIVFAAASLTDAFTELGTLFSAAYPGATVSFNFGGSNQLAQQLEQGARGDVFASAGAAPMETLRASEVVAPGAERVFATNLLVVVFPAANPAGLTQLADLVQPGVRVVLAAAEVPVGQYSATFLAQAAADPAFGPAFTNGLLDNVVSYETSVRGVLSKVTLGEADAGLVYASDAALAGPGRVGQLAIPTHLNVTAPYPIAVLGASPNPAAAQAFVNLVLGDTGQAVLARYGFQGAP